MVAPTFDIASIGETDAGAAWSFTTTNFAPGAGLVCIVQILQDGSTSGAVAATSFNNVENLAGTDDAMDYLGEFQVGASAEAIQHLWIGRTLAGVSMTIAGTNSTSEDLYFRVYAFNDASTGTTVATVIENSTAGATVNSTGTSATASDASVTTLGPDRLAVNFIAVNDDNVVTTFSGETGGDWTLRASYAESTGTDGAIVYQDASMSSAGTIGGGTANITDSDAWGVVGFALIGTTAGSTTVKGFGQAQAQILAFGVKGYGQAQTDVKQTYNQFAQAQAMIYIPQYLRPVSDITTNDWVGVIV